MTISRFSLQDVKIRLGLLSANPRIRKILTYGYWLFIVVVIVWVIVKYHHVIATVSWTPQNLVLAAIACTAVIVRRLFGGLYWGSIVRQVAPDVKVSLRRHLQIYFVTNMATYLPGTYWFIPGRMILYAKDGISAVQVGIATLLEQLLILIGGITLSVFALNVVATTSNASISSFWWLFLVFTLALIVIHPKVLRLAIHIMSKMLRLNQVSITLTYLQTLQLLLYTFIVWVCLGIMLTALTRIFVPTISFDLLPTLTGVYALAWVIGYVTPLAPSGLGIREGVISVALISLGISPETTIIIAIFSRLFAVFEDVFWWFVISLGSRYLLRNITSSTPHK